MAQDDKNIKPNLPERGSDDKNLRKGPKFNIYWIYALIAVALIGYQAFSHSSADSTTITEKDFTQHMLLPGDVQKLDLVENKKNGKGIYFRR